MARRRDQTPPLTNLLGNEPRKKKRALAKAPREDAAPPPHSIGIGGRALEGMYRKPSVVHDYYCDSRTRKFQDVHQCFHDAMLCAGVGSKRAWLMC